VFIVGVYMRISTGVNSEGLPDGMSLFHAAFGKKRAVNLMAQALLD
jgi:hypothetical protein